MLLSRIQLLSCIALMLASLAFAQNREVLGEYRIGIVGQDREDSIYQATHLGALDAAHIISKRDSIDIEIVVLTPDSSQGQDQEGSLGKLFINDADGIIISPGRETTTHSAIRFAQEQGQKIIFFESDLEDIQPLASIVADEYKAGMLAGQTIKELLPSRGRIAILMATDPNPAQKERLRGIRNAIGYKTIEAIVQCEPNYFSAIEAIRKAEDEDRNDLISGWVFLDDWPLIGMPAYPWKAGERPCVAIQSSPTAFMHIDQGYLDALIVHPYYEWGRMSVETLVGSLHNGKSPKSARMQTEPEVIDRLNIKDYRKKWHQWLR
jgi:ABC-type sugar transport system substrate-binding protein